MANRPFTPPLTARNGNCNWDSNARTPIAKKRWRRMLRTLRSNQLRATEHLETESPAEKNNFSGPLATGWTSFASRSVGPMVFAAEPSSPPEATVELRWPLSDLQDVLLAHPVDAKESADAPIAGRAQVGPADRSRFRRDASDLALYLAVEDSASCPELSELVCEVAQYMSQRYPSLYSSFVVSVMREPTIEKPEGE